MRATTKIRLCINMLREVAGQIERGPDDAKRAVDAWAAEYVAKYGRSPFDAASSAAFELGSLTARTKNAAAKLRAIIAMLALLTIVACGADDPQPTPLPRCTDIGAPPTVPSRCTVGGVCTWDGEACCTEAREPDARCVP